MLKTLATLISSSQLCHGGRGKQKQKQHGVQTQECLVIYGLSLAPHVFLRGCMHVHKWRGNY